MTFRSFAKYINEYLLPTPVPFCVACAHKMLSRRLASVPSRGALLCSQAPIASGLSRSYATPAADSKPPVALYGVDGTYASALVSSFSLYPRANNLILEHYFEFVVITLDRWIVYCSSKEFSSRNNL